MGFCVIINCKSGAACMRTRVHTSSSGSSGFSGVYYLSSENQVHNLRNTTVSGIIHSFKPEYIKSIKNKKK